MRRPRREVPADPASSAGARRFRSRFHPRHSGSDIAPGEITFYRLQCDSQGKLRSYIAQGEVLPVKTRSFGGIGVFAIPEMGRFYRHVLVEKRYPHHGAVAFGHHGKALFELFKLLGIQDIGFNQPKGMLYKTENPFA